MANVDVYSPGSDVTVRATAPITAGRFVAVSGNRVGGNISAAPAAAAAKAFGVARDDAATGEVVTIARGNSRVVLVRAAAAIVAGADIEVGVSGQAVTRTSGVAVGYAVNGAASGTNVELSLY